jgi:hypothetical protein
MTAGGLQNKERLVRADLTGITKDIGASYMPFGEVEFKSVAAQYLTKGLLENGPTLFEKTFGGCKFMDMWT